MASSSHQTLLKQAQYSISAHRPDQWPPDIGAEVVFAGRSNVGKSSAINTITQRKGLARTSKTPGRTQQIVFFTLDDRRRLVDLPGYGYAKVPAGLQDHWARHLEQYLQGRSSLRGAILLMDARHPLTALDRQMVDWCAGLQLPTHVLLTKADKLRSGQAKSSLLTVRRELATIGDFGVELFSAHKGTGLDAARGRVGSWLSGRKK